MTTRTLLPTQRGTAADVLERAGVAIAVLHAIDDRPGITAAGISGRTDIRISAVRQAIARLLGYHSIEAMGEGYRIRPKRGRQ